MLFTSILPTLLSAAEAGRLPDSMIRLGIRRLLKQRLDAVRRQSCEESQESFRTFLRDCAESPVAVLPDSANEQHYEVPSEFFELALGPHRKYSCCYWDTNTKSLEEAEANSLRMTCERADIQDGMKILELGCGWGSLSLWMAEHYPGSEITVVSNSSGQQTRIRAECEARGITNLTTVKADINDFTADQTFDRVVSVEMFEHVRNHSELLRRISGWLNPGGKLFTHLFCHRSDPYFFEDRGPEDWMTRFFFAGGMMPSDQLLIHYQDDLRLRDHWRWNGRHYEQTCNAWLAQTDQHRPQILKLFRETYGAGNEELWFQRWRIFFMSCAELFGYHDGNEWWVSHYLFEKP